MFSTQLFRKKLSMAINWKTRNDKMWCNIKKEEAKISVLPSGKFDKYENLTAEKILPSDRSQELQEPKLINLPLGEAFKKQIMPLTYQGEK